MSDIWTEAKAPRLIDPLAIFQPRGFGSVEMSLILRKVSLNSPKLLYNKKAIYAGIDGLISKLNFNDWDKIKV